MTSENPADSSQLTQSNIDGLSRRYINFRMRLPSVSEVGCESTLVKLSSNAEAPSSPSPSMLRHTDHLLASAQPVGGQIAGPATAGSDAFLPVENQFSGGFPTRSPNLLPSLAVARAIVAASSRKGTSRDISSGCESSMHYFYGFDGPGAVIPEAIHLPKVWFSDGTEEQGQTRKATPARGLTKLSQFVVLEGKALFVPSDGDTLKDKTKPWQINLG